MRRSTHETHRTMQHAWRGYAEFAWGENELRPLARRANKGTFRYTNFSTCMVALLALVVLHIL